MQWRHVAQAAEAHPEPLLVEEGEGVAVARRQHDGVYRRPRHGLAAPVDAQPAVGAEACAEGHVRHGLVRVRVTARVRVRVRVRLSSLGYPNPRVTLTLGLP